MANEHSNIVPNMSPTAKVSDFKFWCQKVLPLVYDDSLSYYEVLNKLVVYLNQVIANVNADIDNVEELEADFLLLQSYVNNFFDDIDQLVSYAERAEAAETSAIGYAASAAESATNASTSALNAMDAKDAAVIAKNQAQAALTNAQTAATNAAASATAADTSATNAAASATSASGYATNASASATAAQNSFTLADAARSAAQTAATNADASATAAAGSATDAASSATAAAASAASADGEKAQEMISESEEESTTAASEHNIGTYFRLNGVLYRATENIQIGDTISTSTNCEEIHVDEVLTAQSEQIAEQSKAIADVDYDIGKIELVLSLGYISSNGEITSQGSTSLEVYSDLISVSAFEELSLSIKWGATNSQWVAIAYYNNNKDFLDRDVVFSETTDKFDTNFVNNNQATKYIRITYRTYGDADITMYRTSRFDGNCLKENSVASTKLSSDIVIATRNVFNAPWLYGAYDSNGDNYIPSSFHNVITPANIPVEGGKTYTLSMGDMVNANTRAIYVYEFATNHTFIKRTSYNYQKGKVATFTTDSSSAYVGLMVFCPTVQSAWADNIPTWTQLELGYFATKPVNSRNISEQMVGETFSKLTAHELPSNTVKTIAHRGDDLFAPQCTEPAYVIARKNGHTIAENDLYISKDGHLVMWHDTNLSKLGTNLIDVSGYYMYTDGTDYYWVDPSDNAVYTWDGEDYVASAVSLGSLTQCKGASYSVTTLNLDVLKRIDFGAYCGFYGTEILTFEEWVVLCKKLGMEIYIDRKLTYTSETLTEAAETVLKYGMGEHASWLGLSTSEITLLRTIIDGARCGVLLHPSAESVATYADYNTGRGFFFNGNAGSGMTESVIQLGINAGFDVEVWYVDYAANVTEEQIFNVIRTAISYGVTGITLDHYHVGDAFAYLLDKY